MSKNIIVLNKGDTKDLLIRIPDKLDPAINYILTPNDVVYFAILYPQQEFEDAIILRGYTVEDLTKEGLVKIRIFTEDTIHLPAGIYYYTIKLQTGDTHPVIGDCDDPEELRTIIPRTKLILNR